MNLILANIAGWIFEHKKITAMILAAAAVVCFVLWQAHEIRKARRQAQEAVATSGQIRVDEATANANIAANVANQSLANSNAARTANVNSFNSNYSGARRNYCAEFPEDCK